MYTSEPSSLLPPTRRLSVITYAQARNPPRLFEPPTCIPPSYVSPTGCGVGRATLRRKSRTAQIPPSLFASVSVCPSFVNITFQLKRFDTFYSHPSSYIVRRRPSSLLFPRPNPNVPIIVSILLGCCPGSKNIKTPQYTK